MAVLLFFFSLLSILLEASDICFGRLNGYMRFERHEDGQRHEKCKRLDVFGFNLMDHFEIACNLCRA